ncbi:MAG: hypothetical protein U9N37_06150 [Thermodesulfobacteriota bacterium]|nr:hypothetical protein [Thermodesulfobacteriota bacterium]
MSGKEGTIKPLTGNCFSFQKNPGGKIFRSGHHLFVFFSVKDPSLLLLDEKEPHPATCGTKH